MKYPVLLGAAVLCFGGAAFADTICASGTLASYEALGSSGCTIGTNTVASFQTLSGIFGATPVDPTAITITPIGGNFNPGLMVSLTDTADDGTLFEALFTYTISGNTYSEVDSTVSGTSSTGNGVVTFIQNNCAGGVFGPDGVTGCTGTPGSSLILGDGIAGTSFMPNVPSVNATDDFTLDSGGTGTASGGTFTDVFSAVPEPATYLLTGVGIAFAALRYRKTKSTRRRA
jgi:hypothetical protein